MRWQIFGALATVCVVLVTGEKEGPFNVFVRKIENCKHSMDADPDHAKVDINLAAVQVTGTEQDIRGAITYYNDLHVDKLILSAKTEDPDDPESVTYSKMVSKPCTNPVVGVMLKEVFNADDNCVIKKGTYKIEKMNPNVFIHLLFKGFHYGTFDMIVEWSSKKGGVACVKSLIDVTKAM